MVEMIYDKSLITMEIIITPATMETNIAKFDLTPFRIETKIVAMIPIPTI